MAGEDQYINPIVHAMIASSQLAQSANNAKMTAANQAEMRKLEQQRIDQERTRQENEHDYQQGLLKNATQLLSAHIAQSHNEGLKTLNELSQSGVDLSKAFPGQDTSDNPNPSVDQPGMLGGLPQKVSTVNLPGLGINNVPVSAFPTAEDALTRHLRLIGGEESAKEGALSPFVEAQKQRDFQREMELNKTNHDFAGQQLVQQGANQERIANINGGYRLAAEHEQTRGRLQGIMYAHQLGLGDQGSLIANNIEDSVINGTTPYASLTPDQKRAVEGIAVAKGHVIPKTKDYTSALESAQTAQDLIQQARELANNYSSDSGGGSGGMMGGIINSVKSKIPMTDVASKMDALNGKVNIAAKSLGINRTSNAEMDRLMRSVYSPSRTKQQNLENVESLAKALNTQINSKFPANVPTSQRNYVLGNRGITEFGGYKSEQKTKNAIQLDDGTVIPDTPQNRQLHGLPQE